MNTPVRHGRRTTLRASSAPISRQRSRRTSTGATEASILRKSASISVTTRMMAIEARTPCQERGTGYSRVLRRVSAPGYKIKGHVAESVDHRDGDNRGGRQGRSGQGVDADDQFEGVEGAGQRRIEGAGNGGGRTTTHQEAQSLRRSRKMRPKRDARPSQSGCSRPPARPRRQSRRQDRLQHNDRPVGSDMRPPYSALA